METSPLRGTAVTDAPGREEPTPRHASACPVEEIAAMLGHRWTALVLWHLSTRPKRFGALQRCLPGVTQKVLTERLAVLIDHGVVTRSQPAAFPRQVTYQLSDRGRGLVTILDQLERWAQQPH
jgi:DNA-binding HxlR family transcriptional regulator